MGDHPNSGGAVGGVGDWGVEKVTETVGIFYVERMTRKVTNIYDFSGNLDDVIVTSVECDFVMTVGAIVTKGTATFTEDMPGSFDEAERMIKEYWAKQ